MSAVFARRLGPWPQCQKLAWALRCAVARQVFLLGLMVIEGLWCQMVRSWPRAVGYAMGVKMVVVLSCLARAYGLFTLL